MHEPAQTSIDNFDYRCLITLSKVTLNTMQRPSNHLIATLRRSCRSGSPRSLVLSTTALVIRGLVSRRGYSDNGCMSLNLSKANLEVDVVADTEHNIAESLQHVCKAERESVKSQGEKIH